jgi:subtilisin family serine protease
LRTRPLRRASLIAFIIALMLCIAPGAQAQAWRSAPESQQFGLPSTQGAASPAAVAGGRKRVIVRLRIPFQPEGQLGRVSAVQSQRAAIDRAQDALMSRLANQDVTRLHTYRYIPYIALEVDDAGLKALTAAPEVASVVEDVAEPPLLDVSNPLIGAPTAWAAGATGTGQTVAVLDTGVAKTHPFLSGKVVSEACYSSTSVLFSSTSLCPGGVSESTLSGSGVNCSTSISGCDHGTHVAGIVAGANATFSGVAPDASLIAIQVFSRFDSSTSCGSTIPCVLTYTSDQIKALERVYALRTIYSIAAVNMSLGGGRSFSACDTDARKAAIDNLRSAGIATVIASGNNGYSDSVSTPACISTAIAVGSTTSFGATDASGDSVPPDEVSYFSNSASMVHVLAPGHFIYSSVPGTGYNYKAGTSMATPHVAGAWAVLKSAVSSASVANVLSALTSTGVPITDSKNGITKPRIQLDDALATLFPAPASLTASGVSQTQITLNWSQTNAYETSFKVERSTNGVSGWTQIGTTAANATSYPDTTAACSTTYYYRVRAANSSFNSAYSNTASATTNACGLTLTLSSNSLSFGDQQVDTTSTAQSVTLTNSSGTTLTLNNITVSGDFARSGGTCPTSFPATLAAEASCTIDVTFTPSTTGARTGALTISSDASGSPHEVSLSGTGAVPAMSLSSSSLSFGDQQVDTTSTAQSVTLTNSGGATLNLSDVTVGGDFARSGGTCPANFPATVAAGASCTIDVTFTPSTTGARTGTLSIDSDASGSPHAVDLFGTGTTTPTPAVVALSASSLDFGSQPVGVTSVAQTITLTNTGGTVLTIADIVASGDFGVETTCGATLAAGASCTITVTFTPTVAGGRTGALTITSDAGDSPHMVGLSGAGAVSFVVLLPLITRP